MAAKLAKKENRMDVTALPYGINTPAGFLTCYMVMLPLAFKYSPKFGFTGTPDDFADKVFHGACAANFLGGIFEICGLVLADPMRKWFPRAALFAPIAGVGFVWLGFAPVIDVMREPLVGIIPLALTFTGFFSSGGKGAYHVNIPVAFLIMIVGLAFWWAGMARWDTEDRELNDSRKMGEILQSAMHKYVGRLNWTPFVVLDGFDDLTSRAVAIQVPIAMCSFIETLENTEQAAISGDAFNAHEAMLADGLGTAFGAMCGSVIPTTVYIGHQRHKAIGATAMYSVLNAFFYFILTFSGLLGWLFYLVDPVSIGCILVAVGLMICQFSFEASVPRHYPALLIGLMFPLADMIYFDHFNAFTAVVTRKETRLHGVANMSPAGGFICALIVPAILCDLIDHRYMRAFGNCCIACMFSLFGLMHGNNNVFASGKLMHANLHTNWMSYDLGEIMLSVPKFPTKTYGEFDPPLPDGSEWSYRVDKNPYAGTQQDGWERACNEGWRFAVAYAALAVFCLGHALFQKMKPGVLEPVMDNGKPEGMKEAEGSKATEWVKPTTSSTTESSADSAA